MKYAVLLLALMFAGCDEAPSTEGVSSTDGGYEIKMEDIEVAKEDFPEMMNWDDAKKACNSLGDGWRLPNKVELRMMYEHLYLEEKGNFKGQLYWSSSESRINANYAWKAFFDGLYNGEATSIIYRIETKVNMHHVRAVRTLP